MITKQECEHLRQQAKEIFDPLRGTWIELGKWAQPHRIKWMASQQPGVRLNQHIVDTTHIAALGAYNAGFLEGNTSSTRPWYMAETGNEELDGDEINKAWLQKFTKRTLNVLARSNFYHAASELYPDHGTFNTGAQYIEELSDGRLFFHTLIPGSYHVINNGYGEAVVLVREFSMTIKALVSTYGKNGDWSNFSHQTRRLYERGDYGSRVNVVHIIKENSVFDFTKPVGGMNRKWMNVTYETGSYNTTGGSRVSDLIDGGFNLLDGTFLNVSATKRKPFVVAVGPRNGNFEYGEAGPTSNALGCIKSLNKKAIGKDEALEQMLRPAVQGPANLRKSYISTQSNRFIPLDATSISQGGLKRVFEINPAIGAVIQDVDDLRAQVNQHYYADFLLFLSKNPKTRTATETDAILKEQQLIIGPILQSLNFSYNYPIVEMVMDYVLDTDTELQATVPDSLQEQWIKPRFISVFAQAQRAADLPSIQRFAALVGEVAQIDPSVVHKFNGDKYADLVADRLYIPAGLNRSEDTVTAMREQAQAQAQRQQQMEQMVQASQAAKNIGAQIPQGA